MSFGGFRTPFLLTTTGEMLEWPADFSASMSDVFSFVNTDVNCWFRMSAFFKMPLWLTPIDERGATPLASLMKITLDKEVGLGFLGVPCLVFAHQVVNKRNRLDMNLGNQGRIQDIWKGCSYV